ncbi:ATP-grasp domain-containing protein [Mycobacterium terramassiliense]|uniref:Carbamoyl phosphate synthase n=1 Tax=Mycobacterium terramassiliense TaxID=1841859 RepID=A0A2U3N966_9MYCO|nr:ATP-grasp domain-containing protein [Mycobacterium terramassiliense]SPM28065.1 carbamoyl phosphate synthase [Mycobacterium terramassiliense]
MTLRVAITGVSGDVGRGALRGLRRNPLGAEPIWILGLDAGASSEPELDGHRQLPLVRQPQYPDALKAALEEHGVEVLLPCIDSEIAILSAARGLLAETGCNVVLAPHELVEAAEDKLLTAKFLSARGIRAPTTFEAAPTDGLPLPILAKPRNGHASQGIKLLTDRAALQEFTAAPPRNYCFQQYVEGPEFTVGFLYDAYGVMQDAVAMERSLEEGRTVRARVVDNPDMQQFISRFGEQVPGIGAVNAQLRWHHDNGPLVFEINARLSGSTEMRIAVGCNDPLRLVRHFGRGEPIGRARPRIATVYRRDHELRMDPC